VDGGQLVGRGESGGRCEVVGGRKRTIPRSTRSLGHGHEMGGG
jgi:hypothetical protein